MTAPHRLILASAGTGKTYCLASHMLARLFEGADPARILATTFTRRAAGEILERVVERMYDASTKAKERELLGDELGRPLEQAECRERLIALVRNLDRLHVSTIDAFFYRIARLFTLDLGLAPGWDVVEDVDEERLVDDAVARVLDDADPDEWIELLRDLQKGGASRAVHEVVQSTSRAGLETYWESGPGAWDAIRAPGRVDEETIARRIAELEGLPLPTKKPKRKGAEPEPYAMWVKVHAKLCRCLSEHRWDDFLGETLVQKAVAGEESYSRVAIDDAFRTVLCALAQAAGAELLAMLERQNRATVGLLARFDRAYRDVKEAARAYAFSDLARCLADADPGPDHDPSVDAGGPLQARDLDLWFRLDGQVDHLLVDEFQDTAPVQWRALRPLVEEILAGGTEPRSFFCVGDVKQSIYGWRGADPELLRTLDERYPVLAPAETLSASWRSSRIVLDAVNWVFVALDENPVFTAEDRDPGYRATARRWRECFEAQGPAAGREPPGAAFLLEAPPASEDEHGAFPVLRLAAERVATILAEEPEAKVGVLLRTKRHLPRLIYLLRERGIRASGEGGNPLTDSAAVLELLSLLHLADHPGDSAAAFHAASSALGPVLEQTLGLRANSGPEEREKVARTIRERLVVEGYGAFCAGLLKTVQTAPKYGGWDRRRFAQLVDLAFAHDTHATLRPADFVARVRRQRVEDPFSARVQVMTVHASKGLEFDAVVLPELDERLVRENDGYLTDRPDPAQAIRAVSCRPRKVLRELDPELARLWDATAARELWGELCVLYVAMTRARHRLDMIVRHHKSRTPSVSLAAILRETFAEGAVTADGGLLWSDERNAEPWLPPVAQADADAEAAEPTEESEPSAPKLALPRGTRALATRSPSGEEGGLSRPARLAFRKQGPALARGRLIHRWFEEIEWLQAFDAPDERLLAIGGELERDPELVASALSEFRAMLERPETGALLAEATYARPGETLTVERERSFALIMPDGEGTQTLWRGAFDRVVVRRRGDVVTAAEIVDFKTDVVTGEALDARVEHYRPQLESYRKVLARMTGLALEVVSAKLLFLESDSIVTL